MDLSVMTLKAGIVRTLRRIGYDVVRIGKSSGGSTYKGGEHADTSRTIVEDLVHRRFALDNVKILEGTFPEDTANRIEHSCFRFCHIDVDVYESAKGTIDWIWGKLPVGGIVVFDDYGLHGCDGITKYVEEQRLNSDSLVLHNLNGHGVMIKIKEDTGA